jgi:hypothetical protein
MSELHLSRYNEIEVLSQTGPEQQSDTWKTRRSYHDIVFGSSEIGSILGTNRYSNSNTVILSKSLLRKPFTGNMFTQKGVDYEDIIIGMIERTLRVAVNKTTFILSRPILPCYAELLSDTKDFDNNVGKRILGDSSDGQFLMCPCSDCYNNGISFSKLCKPIPYTVECKCPSRRTASITIPREYVDQIQGHLYNTSYPYCYYAEANIEEKNATSLNNTDEKVTYSQIPNMNYRSLEEIEFDDCATGYHKGRKKLWSMTRFAIRRVERDPIWVSKVFDKVYSAWTTTRSLKCEFINNVTRSLGIDEDTALDCIKSYNERRSVERADVIKNIRHEMKTHYREMQGIKKYAPRKESARYVRGVVKKIKAL